MMTRLLMIGVLTVCLGLPMALPAGAASTFRCDSPGGSRAVIEACGARWSAANIRVHLAANRNGGESEACLTTTAEALDRLATQWLANENAEPPPYELPCGKLPAAASADDDLLGRACPGATWSYENRGAPACDTTLAHLRSQTATSKPVAGPSYQETAQWLADNVPSLASATYADKSTNTTPVFSIADCVVTAQVNFDGFSGSGEEEHIERTYAIPFRKVSSVGWSANPAGSANPLDFVVGVSGPAKAIRVTTLQNGHSYQRSEDYMLLRVGLQDSAERITRALKQLAALCQSSNDPF